MERFCPNCGTRLEEGAEKCPFCGASTGSGGGSAPKSTKKYLAIGGGVIAALAVVFLLVRSFSTANASPVEAFVQAHRDALSFELPGEVETVELSTDMTLSMGVDNTFLNTYFRQIQVGWQLDVSEDSFNTLLDLVWSGAALISAQITYEDGQLGLYIPEASETYYLFDVKEWYEMDGADFDQLEALSQSGLSPEEWQRLCQTYLDIFLETVTEDTLKLEQNKSVSLPELGEKVKADCYTFRPDEEAIEDMLLRLADALEQDEDLRQAMRIFWDQYYPTVMLNLPYDEDLSVYLDDMVRDLREDAWGMAREMEAAGFYVQTCLRNGSICYERIAWDDGDGGEQGFVYESGKSGAIWYLDDDGSCIVSLRHETEQENSGRWTLSARNDWDEEVSIMVDYEIDPEEKSSLKVPYGTYALSLYSTEYTWENEMAFVLTVGPGENGGSDHTLTLTGEELMKEGGLYDMGISEIFFTLHTTDEPADLAFPSAPTVQVHSEEDLQELIDGLEQLVDLLSGQLAGI